jgi:hypothetical protein
VNSEEATHRYKDGLAAIAKAFLFIRGVTNVRNQIASAVMAAI